LEKGIPWGDPCRLGKCMVGVDLNRWVGLRAVYYTLFLLWLQFRGVVVKYMVYFGLEMGNKAMYYIG
jgi:hypothetical protein